MRHKNNKYLNFVRSLPCAHCGNPETIAHHPIGLGMGAMGTKPDDISAVPMCPACHGKLHENSKTWVLPQIRWILQTQNKAQEMGEL